MCSLREPSSELVLSHSLLLLLPTQNLILQGPKVRLTSGSFAHLALSVACPPDRSRDVVCRIPLPRLLTAAPSPQPPQTCSHFSFERSNFLLTMSRDRTAVLWDLSRSPAGTSGTESAGTVSALHRHPSWGEGAYNSGGGGERGSFWPPGGGGEGGSYGESPPARVSTTYGLPNAAPGLCPATVTMLPLSRPPPPTKQETGLAFARSFRGGAAAGAAAAAAAPPEVSNFGEGFSTRRSGGTAGRGGQGGMLPVVFAASGDRVVASVVHRELGGGQSGVEEEEEEVHPVRFVGPSGKTVDGKKGGGGGRRSTSGGGSLVVRSVAVLPLRRLMLVGCADGWVRVGT